MREFFRPKVLVVEGKDEEFFFDALIHHLDLKHIQVMPIGGKTQLRAQLKALVKTPGFFKVISLGVVRDADEDPRAAFQSVCDALRDAGLEVPDGPGRWTEQIPRVSVMLLPGKESSGALEDLCLRTVPASERECMESFFRCLEDRGIGVAHKPGERSKAMVQVFLASKPEPGKRLGEAAQAGYWPWENKAFEEIVSFLKGL